MANSRFPLLTKKQAMAAPSGLAQLIQKMPVAKTTAALGGLAGGAGGAVAGGASGAATGGTRNLQDGESRLAALLKGTALGTLLGGGAGAGLGAGVGGLAGAGLKSKLLGSLMAKTSSEKVSEYFYGDIGDRYIVKGGDDRGKIGTLIACKEDTTSEESIDADGATVTKRKETNSAKLKIGDRTAEFDNPGAEIRRYYGDKTDSDVKNLGDKDEGPVPAKEAAAKVAAEKNAAYCSVGEKYKVLNGDHKGAIVKCVARKSHRSEEKYIDEEGATIRKSKDTRTATLKIDGQEVEISEEDLGYADNKSDSDDCAKAAAAMDGVGQEEEITIGSEKLAKILRRVINGDDGLEQIIEQIKQAQTRKVAG